MREKETQCFLPTLIISQNGHYQFLLPSTCTLLNPSSSYCQMGSFSPILESGLAFDLLWLIECSRSDAAPVVGLACKSSGSICFPSWSHPPQKSILETLTPWDHHAMKKPELVMRRGQMEEQWSSRFVSESWDLLAQFRWMSDLSWCQKAEESPSSSHSTHRLMRNSKSLFL